MSGEWRFVVECGGEQHELVGSGHDLRSLAHDDDAELTLDELGGDPPPCIAIVDAWRATDVPLWSDELAGAMTGTVDGSRIRSVLDAGSGGGRRQLMAIPGGAAILGEQREEIDEMERQCNRLLVLLDAPDEVRRAYVELMSRGG